MKTTSRFSSDLRHKGAESGCSLPRPRRPQLLCQLPAPRSHRARCWLARAQGEGSALSTAVHGPRGHSQHPATGSFVSVCTRVCGPGRGHSGSATQLGRASPRPRGQWRRRVGAGGVPQRAKVGRRPMVSAGGWGRHARQLSHSSRFGIKGLGRRPQPHSWAPAPSSSVTR